MPVNTRFSWASDGGTVTNNGSGSFLIIVMITHTIPTSTNYILNSASHGGSETTSGSKILVWTPTSINPNTSITRSFMVSVTQEITTGDKLTHLLSVDTAQGHYIQNQAISHSVSGAPQLVYLPLIIKN